jgi:glycosyltransferase involved in cell wall biosynthesis
VTLALAVLSAEPDGPSVRHRWVRLAPWLEAEGLALEVVPLPGPSSARAAAFARAAAADLVVLQRRLLRRSDFLRLREAARRLVYDFDDAMPYRDPFRGKPESTARANRFLRVCSEADAVVAGSEGLAALARTCGPRAVFTAPTPVDAPRYGPAPGPRAPGEPPRFVWIGSRATLPYLEGIAAPLARACAALPGSRLLVVADAAPVLPGVPVEHVPWSDAGEAEALRRADAGLMPLNDDPWSRGKCAFKLLQYAATGLPSVASPVGANLAVVEDGRTGLLAGDGAAWEAALLRLGRDAELRARLGAEARRQAESRWSAAVLAPPLARFLAQAARAAPAAPTGSP